MAPSERFSTAGDDDVDAFRLELRTWLDDHLTPEVVEAGRRAVGAETLAVLRQWNGILADGGWAAPAWPSEHGGRGSDVPEQVAYLEEMSRAEAPGPVNVIGVSNIAPAIMTFGTDEQRSRFLRPMLRGDVIWSQGMSEPDAGSDLASLRTSAVIDGDDFVVNGQKTWNSLGHLADWCQLYVRTDPEAPKHRGISCLLVDLRSEGVEARPLRSITGDHSFAELFLSDVRVPRSALLGELNQGWLVAMTTLSYERAGVARLHLMLAKKLQDLRDDPVASKALSTDPLLRQRYARVHAEIAGMRWLTQRALADPGAYGGTGGSLAKLLWSKCDQELAELATDAVGTCSVCAASGTTGADRSGSWPSWGSGSPGRWGTNLLSSRQCSIAGGTTEINRTIVGEQILGLPREKA